MTTLSPLSYATAPLCSLGLYSRRVTKSLVGRAAELRAVEQETAAVDGGMVCVAVEGEPGIGKTRFLIAVEEMAQARGLSPISATADEEIRGPFLLARSIFASPAALRAAEESGATAALERVVDALESRDEPGLEALAPDRRLLRVFDLAAAALRSFAAAKPVAIIIDDLQWADEDSIRLLRYVVRANASSRLFLAFATRPNEIAFINEAVTLLADVERMGLLRRIKLGRFGQLESTEFLQQVLGGSMNHSSAATMHLQAEGVPFILAEQAHAYKDAGLVQQIDGVWTLSRNAERLLPSAVRTLIQRRAARLPEATRACLADAAILGRSFSLRDLREVKRRLGDAVEEDASIAALMAPAVDTGLLVQHDARSAADYSFTHEQIREFLMGAQTPPRRRAVHKAVVDMLLSGGEPAAASWPLLAQHALAAGEAELSARYSVNAARTALESHAAEEALRLVDSAHQVATDPHDRVSLLLLRDDALEMLRQPTQRLEGLAELSALVEALGDTRLRLQVMLRRAAAIRLSEEHDRAAAIARQVRELAAEADDRETELAACLELGQDLFRTELGEGYTQAPSESDFDGAEEAYQRAVVLAEELDDQAKLAAALRELGVIGLSRLRVWFVNAVMAGEHIAMAQRLLAGESLHDLLSALPVAPIVEEANGQLQRALDIFEGIGDRQGAMSTIIAMAYIQWGPEIHLPGSARRIEEIRRLSGRLKSLTRESERDAADAQMLFGAQVYSMAKGFPETAVLKGKEAYDAARRIGDRSLEFFAAGYLALTMLEFGDAAEASRWLDRAAQVAAATPTPHRAYQLEFWRGLLAAGHGDARGTRDHLERAVQLAIEQGRQPARCEALARLAIETARLGAERGDAEMLDLAQRSAEEARSVARLLPGHPPWMAQALASLARVHLARGDIASAAALAREAHDNLTSGLHDDLTLEVWLPVAEALLAGGSEQEAEEVRGYLGMTLAFIAQRFVDEGMRVRWFRGPVGREMTRIAGPLDAGLAAARPTPADEDALAPADARVLQLLSQGLSNDEIAAELGISTSALSRHLVELYARIGVSTRAGATIFALTKKLG